MQNSKPVFLLREVVVREISRFGKGKEHLKLKITSRDKNNNIDAVTFFVKGDIARVIGKMQPNDSATILAHLERDTFSRGNPVRLRLINMRTEKSF